MSVFTLNYLGAVAALPKNLPGVGGGYRNLRSYLQRYYFLNGGWFMTFSFWDINGKKMTTQLGTTWWCGCGGKSTYCVSSAVLLTTWRRECFERKTCAGNKMNSQENASVHGENKIKLWRLSEATSIIPHPRKMTFVWVWCVRLVLQMWHWCGVAFCTVLGCALKWNLSGMKSAPL